VKKLKSVADTREKYSEHHFAIAEVFKMARTRKDQHKVGTPPKARGQQTGFAGNPDQNRQEQNSTPAIRGRRKEANKLAADPSAQNVGSDPVTLGTSSPSTPAMNKSGKGDTGGERVFKQRLAKKRAKS
jgi:hypothetical protein